MGSTQKKQTDSHAVRRIKYGISVTISVLAAVGLVVLLNWLAARQYVRTDLTRGGSYSLSAQSKAVLGKLDDGYRIVTLLPSNSQVADEDRALVYRRVRDMTDEYARYSEGLTVEHLDPRSDITRAESLNAAIAETFKDELTPVVDAIDQGRAALDVIKPINTKLVSVLTAGLNTETDRAETRVQQLFRAAATSCTSFGQTAEQAGRQADDLMNQVLVNYAGVKDQFAEVFTDYDAVLGVIIQSAGQLVRSSETSNAEKELLLEAIELCKQGQAALADPLVKIGEAEDAPRYHRVLYGLAGGESVVMLGPGRVKVVPVSEMWRQDMSNAEGDGPAQPQYLIEEKLTGALLSMTLEQPPMVVFLLSGTGAALGPQGQYNIVGQRLDNADFRVTQWNPAGQVSAMGQPTPPMPRPEAEPGQKTIWVVLPTPTANPMMMANPRQQIADLLQERLAAGDSAMIMLAADPNSTFGVANPITELLGTWGVTAQTDRIILQEVQESNRRSATVLQFMIDTWPDALPITTALNGMQSLFQIASPIITRDDNGATHYPLVEVTGNRLWTHSDLTSPEAVQRAKFSEADSAPSFTIATASERDGKRLITIAERVWASDDMTGYGLFGPGTAELTGAAVPGNSELFVNSVFWLAGLEDLIAASPRSQDVPRIRPMPPHTLWWHQTALLAGMPAAALALGLCVWWVRRRA
jgi:ABC transporter family protein